MRTGHQDEIMEIYIYVYVHTQRAHTYDVLTHSIDVLTHSIDEAQRKSARGNRELEDLSHTYACMLSTRRTHRRAHIQRCVTVTRMKEHATKLQREFIHT